MIRRTVVLLLFLAAVAAAQGTPPKQKPAEYPVSVEQPIALGAEYLVHSVPAARGVLSTPDYLVVEVGFFPPAMGEVEVRAADFGLRLNGKKELILAQSAGMVGASLKYPDWREKPQLEGSAGLGNGGVIIGRPQTVGRFPNDPRPGQSRLPSPPKAPDAGTQAGIDAEPNEAADQTVARLALPEGSTRGPVSGLLFFPFRGKTAKIRTLELLYKGKAGEATLKFF